MPHDAIIPLPLDLKESGHWGCDIDSMEEMRGPRVHFYWDRPYNFPDNGIMKVRFRSVRREEQVQKEKFEETIELVELLEVEDDTPLPPTRDVDEAGKALDKLRGEVEEAD